MAAVQYQSLSPGKTLGVDPQAQHLGQFIGAPIQYATPTGLQLWTGYSDLTVRGQGLTYDSNEQLVGGTITTILHSNATLGIMFTIDGLSLPASSVAAWVAADATVLALTTVLSGDDKIFGSDKADVLRGYGGNDLMGSGAGADTVFGGLGDDTMLSGEILDASTYLRGEEGNDSITGGLAFDDINGNQGDDTCYGGDGDDWVVGGQGNDLLFGDYPELRSSYSSHFADVVYGNMGNDTCLGGVGSDTVRGGQGNDSVSGGGGNDWLSGDRGDDTISGGSGADVFYTFAGSGIDRVVDFNLDDGDRIQLDRGQAYTLKQVGNDAVVDLGGGDQMILVGVQTSTLVGGWMFTL